jgi:hypothetical protein
MHLSGFTVINKKNEIRSRKMKPAYVINKHANNCYIYNAARSIIFTHMLLFYSIP